MSDVEKLRALLAEARDALSQGCWSGKCCTVRANIDAALAEPITLTQSELDRMLADAKQQGMRECPHHRIDAGIINRAIREAEGKAYRRGAEAMREAAASCVGGDTAVLQTYRSVLEGRIRALPVPEER